MDINACVFISLDGAPIQNASVIDRLCGTCVGMAPLVLNARFLPDPPPLPVGVGGGGWVPVEIPNKAGWLAGWGVSNGEVRQIAGQTLGQQSIHDVQTAPDG